MKERSNEYHVDALTVVYWDSNGVATDLNAEGEPCVTKADLVEFVYELCEQGAYGGDIRRQLIEEATDTRVIRSQGVK